MEQRAKRFYQYLKKTKQMKENTILSYQRDVNAFLNFCRQNGHHDITTISEDFAPYLAYLEEIGRSPSTRSRNIASLRSFFRYLVTKKLIPSDPTKNKKYEKAASNAPKSEVLLTTEEIDRLIICSKTEDIKGLRDCAMLETLYATGLKTSEFLKLRVDDVHLKEGYLTVEEDGHTRYVPLYRGAVSAIRIYLRQSRKYLTLAHTNDYLFLNLKGEPFSRQGLWKFLKEYGKKANISKEITPHLIRKSMALHLMENGADLEMVQELLGHKNIALTKSYVKNFRPRIVSDYRKYHPKSQD
ncbi:MAG: site-specific tyrosine recombinase XerD [Ruminococcaceae bacterium]|nr:site-specific tyrosine recombinase XerD [Oscillospiraceae bacterium]